jgi:Xaa-Pro dipeptidase
MQHNVFPRAELDDRLQAVRQAMSQSGLDALVVSVPENIYYLTGLDHWGFFACHVLVVPAVGEMALACRAMERITVGNQVENAEFSNRITLAAPRPRRMPARWRLSMRFTMAPATMKLPPNAIVR